MKNRFITSIGWICIATVFLAACSENGSGTAFMEKAVDSANNFKLDSSIVDAPPFIIRPDNTYVDIAIRKQVRVILDTATGYIIDVSTSRPVNLIVDPSTKDTFDYKGRNVNNKLIKTGDNAWTIDESKMNKK
jgi:hypothetical protein